MQEEQESKVSFTLRTFSRRWHVANSFREDNRIRHHRLKDVKASLWCGCRGCRCDSRRLLSGAVQVRLDKAEQDWRHQLHCGDYPVATKLLQVHAFPEEQPHLSTAHNARIVEGQHSSLSIIILWSFAHAEAVEQEYKTWNLYYHPFLFRKNIRLMPALLALVLSSISRMVRAS